MEKQFVTEEIALKLKKLGFNEPCLAMFQKNGKIWFTKKKEWIQNYATDTDSRTLEIYKASYPDMIYELPNETVVIKKCVNFIAPLWQQAIDWIRSEHDIIINLASYKKDKHLFQLSTYDDELLTEISEWHTTYEETRKQAILSAIEIINNRYNVLNIKP